MSTYLELDALAAEFAQRELTQALPGVENIERSLVNAWDEPQVRNAVRRTGPQKLLIAGITTPVCLTSAATSAASDGYDVYALLDASGTWSDLLRLTAIDQMKQAGVKITSGVAAFTEMLRITLALSLASTTRRLTSQPPATSSRSPKRTTTPPTRGQHE
jgi:Isochorismatase family